MSGRGQGQPLVVLDRIDRYIARVFWSSYGVSFLFFFGFRRQKSGDPGINVHGGGNQEED